ncbi:replication/maintenance protein RepL [Helicobacter pylori]|uniref:replication/maintenance protein RepL n=1 Tax=Helicobacter pylori TaxID=210 RepID=UPI0002BB74AF|nr:replication/maintenance protein RepL [Helicobacter pylori]EMG91789.1 firmicute plasmid replication protein [Helicobacter pylori GAM201Ai]
MSDYYRELYEMSDEETPGKKIYYKGEETWVNADTGEIKQLDVIKQEIKHSQKYFKGWRRVYLFQLFDILLDLCGNSAKLRVIDFVLSHLDDNNHLNMNQKQVCEKIQAQELKEGRKNRTSITTVNQTFQALVEANALTKSGSIYIFNPKLANAFGSDRKNRAILLEFEDAQMRDRLRKQEVEQKAEKLSNFIKESF